MGKREVLERAYNGQEEGDGENVPRIGEKEVAGKKVPGETNSVKLASCKENTLRVKPRSVRNRSVLEQNSSRDSGLQDVVRRAAFDDEAENVGDHGSVTTLNDPKGGQQCKRKTHEGDAGNRVRGFVVVPSATGEGLGWQNIMPEVVRNVIMGGATQGSPEACHVEAEAENGVWNDGTHTEEAATVGHFDDDQYRVLRVHGKNSIPF